MPQKEDVGIVTAALLAWAAASALRFSREGAAVGVVDIDDVHRGRGRGNQGGTRRLVRGFPAEESFHPMSKNGCPLVPA